jgi:hypothetical protein
VAGPPNLRLLAGHSWGNVLISFVLRQIAYGPKDRATRLRESRHRLCDPLAVVTLGAVADIHTKLFELEARQFLGRLDWLGHMNSSRHPPYLGLIAPEHELIPGARHHLNPIFPAAKSIEEALRRAGLP